MIRTTFRWNSFIAHVIGAAIVAFGGTLATGANIKACIAASLVAVGVAIKAFNAEPQA